MWSTKKIHLNLHYIFFRILQKKARSQKWFLIFCERVCCYHLKIVLQASRHSPCASECEKHRCSISASPSTAIINDFASFHFTSGPFTSLVQNQRTRKGLWYKEQDTNGFRWTKFHIFRSAKNDINIAVNCDPMQKYIFDWSPAGCDYQLRLILVGESTVGKTSLIRSPDHVVHKPEFQTIYGIKWTKH